MIKDLVNQENLKLSNAVSTAKGFVATHKNVIGGLPPVSLMLGGKTVQNGTPTPDAPVDIVGVGESGSLKAVSCKKNLCPLGSVTGTVFVNIPIDHLADGTYTLSCVVTSTDTDQTTSYLYKHTETTETAISAFGRGARRSTKFTKGANDVFIRVYASMGYSDSIGDTVTVSDIQIELGNTATPYEPYTGTEVNIPLTAPLYEKDYILYNMDGSGELIRKKKAVVFDGSSDENFILQSINSYGIANFYVSLSLKAKSESAISDRFEPQKTLIGNTMNEGVYNNETLFYIRIKQERAKTAAELKTWLQANPITVVYELAEPTVTPLTTLQIRAIESLLSQDGLTNVMSEGMVESGYLANNADGKLISELINIYDAKINELQSDVDTVEEKMIYCGEGDSYMGVNYDGEIAKITIAENESREIYMTVKQILEQHDKVLELLAAK